MKNIFFFFQISLGWRFSASANFSPTLKPDSDPEASGTVPTVQFSYVVLGEIFIGKSSANPDFALIYGPYTLVFILVKLSIAP